MFKPKIWDQKKGLTATISETQTALPEPKSSTQALAAFVFCIPGRVASHPMVYHGVL